MKELLAEKKIDSVIVRLEKLKSRMVQEIENEEEYEKFYFFVKREVSECIKELRLLKVHLRKEIK